jgi:Protein of unknown function (DUF2795)
MDRGNSQHGPRLDEEMAHETEDIVRDGHSSHTEEWRQPEPAGEGAHVHPLGPPTPGGPDSEEIELRSELARVMDRHTFPASRDDLLRRVQDAGTPPALADGIAALPADSIYSSVGDVARALGLVPEDGAW